MDKDLVDEYGWSDDDDGGDKKFAKGMVLTTLDHKPMGEYMSWFLSWPYLLNAELKELSSNSNYKMVATHVNRTLVSCGEIIVRLSHLHRFPVLIVYPDATPYALPKVFLLKQTMGQSEVQRLAGLPPDRIESEIKDLIKFYYRRHQGRDGSLCLLEQSSDEVVATQAIGIRAVIERVRQWLRGFLNGNFPPDNPEVELYCHFPNNVQDKIFLLPEEYYDPSFVSGYYYLIKTIFSNPASAYYFGFGIDGFNINGVILKNFIDKNKSTFLKEFIPDWISTLNHDSLELNKVGIIRGFWWQTEREPNPFYSGKDFAEYVDEQNGLAQLSI